MCTVEYESKGFSPRSEVTPLSKMGYNRYKTVSGLERPSNRMTENR